MHATGNFLLSNLLFISISASIIKIQKPGQGGPYSMKNKKTLDIILKAIIAVASAIIGAIGGQTII